MTCATAADTSWIGYSRFIIRTIRLDTLKDTFDIIPKPAPGINWGKFDLEAFEKDMNKKHLPVDSSYLKMHDEINLLRRRISELEDKFDLMQGAKDLNQMRKLLKQNGY
jgi:hypothetical protein